MILNFNEKSKGEDLQLHVVLQKIEINLHLGITKLYFRLLPAYSCFNLVDFLVVSTIRNGPAEI